MFSLLLTLSIFNKFIYVSVVSFVFTKLLGIIPTKKKDLQIYWNYHSAWFLHFQKLKHNER